MTKPSYKEASNKRIAREFLFSFYNKSSIVGLAGPDINDYIKWCKSMKFDNVELWENNSQVMLQQLANIKSRLPISYNFGDIVNADNGKDALYDLDFCSNITSLYSHIKKFRDEKFVITFSNRPISVETSIELFFSTRKESVISSVYKKNPIPHYSVRTSLGRYIIVTYFDTCSMVSIAKI